MWQLLTPSRERIEAGRASTGRKRVHRPGCTPLEDRCLLSVSLSNSGSTIPVVGAPVVWTATASGHGATPVYQFRVGQIGGSPQVVRDYSPSNRFTWDPVQEGSYQIEVTVKNSYGASTGESSVTDYTAASRVVGTSAVISPTSNPLVALYSAPPSPSNSMYVQFKPLDSTQSWNSTAPLPIVPGQSTNFLVAGMLPNTTYVMRNVLDNGTVSALSTFQTGSLPTNLTFPTFSVQQAPSLGMDPTQNMVFHAGINPPDGTVDTVATDLSGNIVWYYDSVANAFPSYATNLVPGGTVLLLGGQQDGVGGAHDLREVNLAGDTLRETNIDAVNAELTALGQHTITNFNHEALRLPNGDTAVLATTPRIVNLNGTPTRYEGDMVIVLDQNFQVSWVWDPFKSLDTNRLPTLGEGPTDWLHANSISWSPEDGNLIVSLRSQDWVVKIDYANGTGDGHVIWRLGPGGDFSILSSDPSPWFSHQHDVTYINDSTILLFDNGNTRQSQNPQADSRVQELVLNEQTMQATLVANVDVGNYAFAVGSAQRLPNGNFAFDTGFTEQSIETLPDGTRTYVLKMNMPGLQYRSYFLQSLYGSLGTFVSPPTTATPISVDLSSTYNRVGIVSDGTTFDGGLDGVGSALSATLVGTSVGSAYALGPADLPNVVASAGQVIPLPAGSYGTLKLLATGVLGRSRTRSSS